jgi:Uma2 family endonuclease
MPEDGVRREIIGGDLLMNPAPRFDHQIVVANIHERLAANLVEEGNFRVFESPINVFVSRHDVVQPDLIVIAQRAVARFRREGIVDEPPILVVEVSSPSTALPTCAGSSRSTSASESWNTGLSILRQEQLRYFP